MKAFQLTYKFTLRRFSSQWQNQSLFSPVFYADLTKAKLTSFVLLTTMAGYAIAPGVSSLSTLLLTTLGTGMCVASANSINQWTEIPYDAQMSRTRNRVLVR
jgi:protoheme IX farnesyltransferase